MGTLGKHWKLSEKTKQKMRKPKSEAHRIAINLSNNPGRFKKGHISPHKNKKIIFKYICKFCKNIFNIISSRRKGLFCSHSCQMKYRFRCNLERKGWISSAGYKELQIANKSYRLHRLIMEKYLNRKLNFDEIVHHINEDRLDNKIENLRLTTRSEHSKLHKMWLKGGKCVWSYREGG